MTHPLKTWLRDNNEARIAFAARIGVNDSTLHRVMKGTHDTSTATLRAISEGTGGEVTEAELYDAWRKARGAGDDRSTNMTDKLVSCEAET